MARNTFIDPTTGEVYAWPINHSDEEEGGRDRAITTGANTGNVGLVKQQGELTPIVLRYTGTILQRAQYDAMLSWYARCESHTIYFTDFAGDSYEVIISAFHPRRQRTLRNPRDPSAPFWYWTYTIEMTVMAVRAGAWMGQPA